MEKDLSDALLLRRFIDSFHVLDDCTCVPERAECMDLAVPEPSEYGVLQWRPREVTTPRAALEPVYKALPGPFPPLFEDLLLSYRWATVDLEAVELLANPLSPALNGFVDQVASRFCGKWRRRFGLS